MAVVLLQLLSPTPALRAPLPDTSPWLPSRPVPKYLG